MTPEEMDGLMTCMSEMAPDVTVQEGFRFISILD